jgi:putative peptide zinc metalloprotease protein
VVVALPLPFYSTVQGVVQVSESGVLRPQVEGLVIAVHAPDGARVQAGDLVLMLDDPVLRVRLARAVAKVSDIEAERFGQLGRDALRATDGEEALARARAEVVELESRVANLAVRAAVNGQLSLPRAGDLPGAWLERGRPVGHVFDGTALRVRAAVPESQAGLLRERLYAVQVRLAERSAVALEARVVRDAPAAVTELPGDALGRLGDGGLETDPSDRRGVRARDPYVHVDVQIDAAQGARVDGRAWVRFDHGSAALLERAWRSVRQVFLRRFDATA